MSEPKDQTEAACGGSALTAELGALPCPFCGSTKIGFADGSTFRWLAAVCENCGAQAEEVRIDTLMPCRAAAEAMQR